MNFKVIAVSALLAASAVPSFAQEAPTIPLVLTPTSATSASVTFDRNVSGLFVDTFSFTPATFAGTVSVDLMPVTGPINFFSALLNGQGFSFFPEDGQTDFTFSAVVSAADPLELTVFGYAGDASTLTDASGAYRGTITTNAIAAVPEPQTYALLLAGLVAIAAFRPLRRRRALPLR